VLFRRMGLKEVTGLAGVIVYAASQPRLRRVGKRIMQDCHQLMPGKYR
jgi:hypothetical protein